ncbi:MAG: single-stranded DNA-binding protein [Chitinophagales bacterium]|nr:single-stranded DNA-binding protein [Chitinophagales bacterium]
MVNKIFLLGNLGKDPEVKYFDENNVIASFPLATNETYIDKQGAKVTQTEWHNIRITRTGLAKVAEQYLKKGDMIFVEGKMKTRSYEDKEGVKKFISEVIIDSMKMLSKKANSEHGDEQKSNQQTESMNTFSESSLNDDLPF